MQRLPNAYSRAFLLLLLLTILASCGEEPAPPFAPVGEPPSVVLITADDLGYGDLGAYGNVVVRTQHLDGLAREGIRFPQGYVSAPLCAVSRAALLTGRDHNRYGYRDPGTYMSEKMGGDHGLSTSEVLLSDMLAEAGYATGAFGKWHLGSQPRFHPLNRGFQTFFGFMSGAHDYYDWGSGIWGAIFRGHKRAKGSGYLTDAITHEAVTFIEAHAGSRPFFAYVAYNAIHSPFQAPEEQLATYAHLPESERIFAAMITAMDEGIGRILAALARLGLEENTLVIFLSDNGGAFTDNGSLRAGKGSLYEGGIRVPFLVRWPAALPSAAVYDEAVTSLDLLPTIMAAASVPIPSDHRLDGVDLLPSLRGEHHSPPHEALFWRWRTQWAVRVGSMKLVHGRHSGGEQPTTGLFDLSADIGESHDVSRSRPETVRELEQRLSAWDDAIALDQ